MKLLIIFFSILLFIDCTHIATKCPNDAINPPTCDKCEKPKVFINNSCKLISDSPNIKKLKQ